MTSYFKRFSFDNNINNDQEKENFKASLLDSIPEYKQILDDLGRGKLKADFCLANRKSKLCHSLDEILFDENNDELSYFVLFMDANASSNYVKFLLDLRNFQSALEKSKLAQTDLCTRCLHKSNENDDPKEHVAHDSTCTCFQAIKKTIAEDALSMFSKYISKDAKYPIDLSDDIINETMMQICPEDDKEINLNCFESAKRFVYRLLIDKYYDKYVVSEYHCKYLNDTLQNRLLSLGDILYDDIAIVFLLEFLEQESYSELLKFWIQAENFSRNVLLASSNSSNDDCFKQLQNDAIIIYDNFISLQAKSPLGFDSIVRCQVEMNICQNIDQEPLEYLLNSYADCFYVPMLIVFSILDKVFFGRFLTSHMYKKYMNEIAINSSYLTSKMKRSSQSSSNTSSRSRRTASRIIDTDSNYQPTHVDADSLWIRPNACSDMQIGRIDLTTGRYIRVNECLDEKENYHISHNYLPSSSSSYVSTALVNRLLSDNDDIWTIEGDTQSSREEKRRDDETTSAGSRLRSRFNRLINVGRSLSARRTSANDMKASQNEQELAERVAAMLVNDVIRANNQLKSNTNNFSAARF